LPQQKATMVLPLTPILAQGTPPLAMRCD
jgi:hypothetical protein